MKVVVITGLSGSGKSSLVFDLLYAEWQRRHVENLSAYTRQFLDEMKKPDVDFIEGLSLPSPSSSAAPGQSQDRQSRLQVKFTIICVCFFRRSVNRRSHSRGGHLKRLTVTAIFPRTPTSTASLRVIP
jgi:excinuclease UvrABC ATPase subunit